MEMSTHLAMGSTGSSAMEKSTPGMCQEEVEESRGVEMNKSRNEQIMEVLKLNVASKAKCSFNTSKCTKCSEGLSLFVCVTG